MRPPRQSGSAESQSRSPQPVDLDQDPVLHPEHAWWPHFGHQRITLGFALLWGLTVWVDQVESVYRDLEGVDVAWVGEPFEDEPEQCAQGFLAEFQRVERQRV